jgi:hypothetical protein
MNCGDQLSLFRKVGGGLVGIMNMALQGKRHFNSPEAFHIKREHFGPGSVKAKVPGLASVLVHQCSGSVTF